MTGCNELKRFDLKVGESTEITSPQGNKVTVTLKKLGQGDDDVEVEMSLSGQDTLTVTETFTLYEGSWSQSPDTFPEEGECRFYITHMSFADGLYRFSVDLRPEPH